MKPTPDRHKYPRFIVIRSDMSISFSSSMPIPMVFWLTNPDLYTSFMLGPLLRDDSRRDGWFLPDDLSHFLDLVWAVCGITVDLFALGRFVSGLHPHNLAGVVVNDGVDGLVEHVGPTVDSRQPRESLNEVQVGSKSHSFLTHNSPICMMKATS